MSGLNGMAWTILRLANWLAGPDRREWVAAMAAETDAKNRHGVHWALGCLGAVVSERLVDDRWFLLALVILPGVTLIVLTFLGLLVAIAARAAGLPMLELVPLMLLGPLPVAWLLGRIRPFYSPRLVGTIAFMIHQAVPLLAMWALTGRPPEMFWSANVTYYEMPAIAGLFASWLVWIIGTYWGSHRGRSRLSAS